MRSPGWRTLRSRFLYRSRYCSLRRDRVRLPTGFEFDHHVVEIPEAVCVVPVLDDGSVVLLHQYRYPANRMFWELPAGRMHPDETPLGAARRELREEAGFVARRLVRGPTFYPVDGISPHRAHAYFASGLRAVPQELDATEHLRVDRFHPDEVLSMIRDGRISDGFSLIALQHEFLFRRDARRRPRRSSST
jgi:ADP-ribose pyrophosphatase